MIEEALTYLTDMVRDATKPFPIEPDDPRKHRYSIGGDLVTVDVPIPARDHDPDSLADLVQLANRFAKKGQVAVWYDHDEVILVIDDDGHRIETSTLSLVYTEVWKRLVDLARSKPWFEQKPFVRLLNIDLHGTMDPVTLLNKVRKIKFDNGVIVKGEVSRQKESLTRDIRAEATSDGAELPEFVILDVPMLSNYGEDLRLSVKCAVEVEPSAGALRLMPVPDEVRRVQNQVIRDLGERLSAGLDEGISFYVGKPS